MLKCGRFLWNLASASVKRQVLLTFLLNFLCSAALLVQPLLIAGLIKDISAGSMDRQALLPVLALLISAMLASALFARIEKYFHNILLQTVRYKSKAALYAYILSRDAAFFRKHNEGWLESSIATASLAARSIVHDTMGILARVVIFILLAAGLLFFTAPLFGLLFLAASLFYLYLSYRWARNTDIFVKKSVEATAAAAARGSDIFANYEQISLTNMAEPELKQMDILLRQEQRNYYAAQAKIDKAEFCQKLYLALLFGAFILATGLIAGGDSAAAVLFYLIGLLAYSQLDSTGTVLNSLFEMMHKLNSALDALDYPHQPKLPPRQNSADAQPAVAETEQREAVINLSDVSFGYAGHKLLIERLNLRIKAGEHILIIGESGAGKSTLLKLIAGLLMPLNGEITLNGIETRTISSAQRAEILTFISQHANLFDRSLFENTVYSCQNITRAQAKAVLLALGLQNLEAGKSTEGHIEISWLNREISKNGLSLSGGERQRVLLARAVLRNRPIMILDEATSALDAESEKQVFSALHKFCGKATIIAVSHHPHKIMGGYRTVFLADCRTEKAEL